MSIPIAAFGARPLSPAIVAAVLMIAAALFACTSDALAHRPSDASLSLSVSGSAIEGRWDIALRDLDRAVGLDTDQDGAVTWGEVKARQAAIAAYALGRLEIRNNGTPCMARAVDHLIDRHGGEAYAVLYFSASCTDPVGRLDLAYNLMFELDPSHRGLLQVDHADATYTAVLSADDRVWRGQPGALGLLAQIRTYFIEGVWHIWIGFDHILFLVSLLLPAVQRRVDNGWQPVASFRDALLGVVKIVTAFTVAHSITLCFAAVGWLSLPGRLVEPVIAASIILAALNNIRPIVSRRLWAVAFGFGLVHGVGFAGVLQELGLPAEALVWSLLSFNVGVEAGQLAIVSVFLPIAYAARMSAFYRRAALQAGSLVIVAVATLWLIERAFDVALIS